MSDLVRGVVRRSDEEPAPPQEPPPRPPQAPSPEAGAPWRAARPAAPPADTRAPEAPTPVPRTPPPTARLTEEAQALFSELVGEIERVRGGTIVWGELQQTLERVERALESNGAVFWIASRPTLPPATDYLSLHQARVAVLAMRIAANLGYERLERVRLGLAGSVIDVGLWQLPALVKPTEAFTEGERSQYQAHPRMSADLLRRSDPPWAVLVDVVLQHHERERGQGFPQGLAGARVHPDAKLLGLVDTYAGLTLPPGSGPGLPPHEAIREIVRSRHEAFPPALIKALLSEMSVFPPGTLVRLNTGEIGFVIAVNRHHPLRPWVEICDAHGRRQPSPKLIDLAEAPFVYITGPIDER